MKLIVIAAVAENGVIGHLGKIPWHFSEDFGYFKNITLGHTIVMGRKTFESIGKPLPGRKNIVLSSTLINKKLVVIRHFQDIFQMDGDVYICGGSMVYKEALPLADEMVITHVPGIYNGDRFFPTWPVDFPWQEFSCEKGCKKHGLVYKKYRKIYKNMTNLRR